MPTRHRLVYKQVGIDLEGQYGTVDLDDEDDPRLQPGSESKFVLLLVANNHFAARGILLVEENEKEHSRVGLFEIRGIWPKEKEDHWEVDEYDGSGVGERSPEEIRARMRSLWGSEENIRQIVLI